MIESKSKRPMSAAPVAATWLKFASLPTWTLAQFTVMLESRSKRICSWNRPIVWPISWMVLPVVHEAASMTNCWPPVRPTPLEQPVPVLKVT